MIPYPDAGFLLTLLIETGGSSTAQKVLRDCDPPFRINSLHQLQVENLLLQLEKAPQEQRRRAGTTGARLWGWYFAEGLFQLSDVDWTNGFRLAITWNSESKAIPAAPLLLLHPALAVISDSTHFLSFDPRSRHVASQAGLQLLPERL